MMFWYNRFVFLIKICVVDQFSHGKNGRGSKTMVFTSDHLAKFLGISGASIEYNATENQMKLFFSKLSPFWHERHRTNRENLLKFWSSDYYYSLLFITDVDNDYCNK